MNISSAVFHTGVATLSGFPAETVPEVVFVGRSNVGKSSLLNSLTGQKGLAKTSSVPGKTRLINFFSINHALYFVDLPGYGYAAAGRGERASWLELLESYLSNRRSIALVLLLIDSRHPLMTSDRRMALFLEYHALPYGIVMTKDDKLSQRQRSASRRAMEGFSPKAKFIVNYSSSSGKGRQELLEHIAFSIC